MSNDVTQAGVLKEFFKFLGSTGTKVNVTPIAAAELMNQVSPPPLLVSSNLRKMLFFGYCLCWLGFLRKVVVNPNGAWICFGETTKCSDRICGILTVGLV
jgi:hypothetical protein